MSLLRCSEDGSEFHRWVESGRQARTLPSGLRHRQSYSIYHGYDYGKAPTFPRRRKVSLCVKKASLVHVRRIPSSYASLDIHAQKSASLASQRRSSICLIQGGAGKPTRRLSEPFLFHAHNAATTKSLNRQQLANWKQGYAPRRRLSTTAALIPASSRLKLRAIAKDELLASLNVPLNEEEDQNSISEERDSSDEDLQPDTSLESDHQAEKDRLEEKRRRVIEEIVSTEQKYIECLDTMETVFKIPMLNQGIASEKDIRTLFPACLSAIRENHVDFLEELEERSDRSKVTGSIGDIFDKISGPSKVHLLDLYTDYVNAFPKAISTFGRCSRQSQKFRKFIQESYRHPGCGNLDLPSYLITPVQRLPRYVLLLRQLLKYTREDHADTLDIRDALAKMETLICCLNDSIQSSMLAFCSGSAAGRRGTLSRHISRKKKKRGKDGSDPLEKSSAVKRSSSEPVTHSLRGGKNRPMSMVQVQVDAALDQGYCSLSEKKDGIPEDAVGSNLSLSLEGAPGLLMFPKSRLKRCSSPNILAASMLGSNGSIDSNGMSLRVDARNSELRKSWRRSLTTAITAIWSPPPMKEEPMSSSPSATTTPTTTTGRFTFEEEDVAMTMEKDTPSSEEPCSVEVKAIGSTVVNSSSENDLRARSNSSLARRKYGVSYPKSASCGDGLSEFLERLDASVNSESAPSTPITPPTETNNNSKVAASDSFKSKKRGSFMGFRRRRSSRRNSNLGDSESDHDERLSSVSSGSPGGMPIISDCEVLETSSAPSTPMAPLSRRASKQTGGSTRGSTLSLFFQKSRNKSMSKACSERDLTCDNEKKDGEATRKSSTRQRIVGKFKSRANKNERRSMRQQSTTSLPDMIEKENRRLGFDDTVRMPGSGNDVDVSMVTYRRKSNDEFFRAASVDNLAMTGRSEDAVDNSKAKQRRKTFRKSLRNFVSFNTKW